MKTYFNTPTTLALTTLIEITDLTAKKNITRFKTIITAAFTTIILLLYTSCQALPHITKMPYEKSVEITKQEDLTNQFEITEKAYNRTGYVYHYIKSNQESYLLYL